MKEVQITKYEEGIRLSKYIKKILPLMNDSLIYKLLRKKYFELNGKKADGKETLKTGDRLSIFLGKETYEKFLNKGDGDNYCNKRDTKDIRKNKGHHSETIDIGRIIYEDDNIIVYNKPVGMLSQGDKTGQESVNTMLNNYMESKVARGSRSLSVQCSSSAKGSNGSSVQDSGNGPIRFKPSVVNRLDRNTEGLIIFAKTYIAAREISKMIKEQKLEKHYKTIVNGVVDSDEGVLLNYYKKDEKSNKAIIKDIDEQNICMLESATQEKIGKKAHSEKNIKNTDNTSDFDIVKLKYKVLRRQKSTTILDIDLITGKSHQIRAQLAHIGHPIICDKKYMDAKLYNENVSTFAKKSQELKCYKIKFGKFTSDLLKNLNNKVISIDK